MIMSGKECTRLSLLMLVQILHNGPCYRDAVIGGSTTSQFVEEHQRARRYIIQNVSSLSHLHHKGRLSQRDIVAGSHTGEDLIHQTYSRTLSRNKTTHLSQQNYQSRLSQQSRFTSHIRTRNHHNLLFLGIEQHIIGHISFP